MAEFSGLGDDDSPTDVQGDYSSSNSARSWNGSIASLLFWRTIDYKYSFEVNIEIIDKVSVTGRIVHGWFFMNRKGKIDKDVPLPKVVRSLEELNEMLPLPLDNKYEINILCQSYSRIFSAKWNFFVGQVQEVRRSLGEDVGTLIFGLPTMFQQIMSTPLNLQSWRIFVWKLDGIIYTRTARDTDVAQMNLHRLSKNALMNFHRFLKLQKEDEDMKLYEEEKFYKLSSFRFNDHSLVTINAVNAVEENESGELSEVRIAFKGKPVRETIYFPWFFKIWSHAVLCGQKKIIMGNYSENFQELLSVTSMDLATEMIFEGRRVDSTKKGSYSSYRNYKNRFSRTSDDILNFLDRFLTFVKEVMNDDRVNNNGRVVSFQYIWKADHGTGYKTIYPHFQNFDYKKIKYFSRQIY